VVKGCGRDAIERLASPGVIGRSPSLRAVLEEAPTACRHLAPVISRADRLGFAPRAAMRVPIACIEG
jgi:hypothetical protein